MVEKTNGLTPPKYIKSLTLEHIRTTPIDDLVAWINHLTSKHVVIVNAFDYQDLKKVALAILQSDLQPLLRTAASFVAALLAKPIKPLLDRTQLSDHAGLGGLVVVGSYVPKTTQQLAVLLQRPNIQAQEINVAELINDPNFQIGPLVQRIDQLLSQNQVVVVYTSRALISGKTNKENLTIGFKVSHILTQIMQSLTVRPRFLVAKGGITSSDIATKGLGVQRAMVMGQVIKGVPVWELGKETKFPGLPYIIFPGNVGTEESLNEVVERLSESGGKV